MAKFRLSPELVKLLIPVVIPIVEDLAKRTTTTVDDKLVDGLKAALSNPVVLAFLLSILEGQPTVPPQTTLDELSKEPVASLVDNADLLSALFSVAKVA